MVFYANNLTELIYREEYIRFRLLKSFAPTFHFGIMANKPTFRFVRWFTHISLSYRQHISAFVCRPGLQNWLNFMVKLIPKQHHSQRLQNLPLKCVTLNLRCTTNCPSVCSSQRGLFLTEKTFSDIQ